MQITISYNKGRYNNYNTAELEKEFRQAEKLSEMLWYDESFPIYGELAKKNYMPAVYKLGLAYYYGEGVECDDNKAFSLFEKGAASGHLPSMKSAGDCCKRGYGTDIDKRRAYLYYLKAAKKNYIPAMQEAARCCVSGIGTKKNYARAISWLKKIIALGDNSAYIWLVYHYEEGLGVNYDYQKAFECYMKCRDDPTAQYKIAQCFELGIGTIQDIKLAINWYNKAIVGGHAMSLVELGRIYESGADYIEQDLKKAVALFKSAAKIGVSAGQCKFADYLYKGIVVDRDINLAYMLYSYAAQQGDSTAKERLKTLYNEEID